MNFNNSNKKVSESSSVGKNAVYQTIYQLLVTFTPLITSPHISRELQAEKLGEFSYSYSVVSYFMLIALLGIINYGTRTIAETENDTEKLSVTFWNIYFMQFLSSFISICLYIIYILSIPRDQRLIAILQGVWLLGAMTDVSWFYFGVEKFKVTVTVNIFIKIFTVISVVTFVQSGNFPLITYTFIMSFGHLLSSLILFIPLKNYVKWKKPNFQEVKKHFCPNIKLFVPLIAASVFHTMDKTMLGKIASYEELGYYYNADKLVNIPLGVINGFGTVFLPRASKLFSTSKNHNAGMSFLNKTFEINIAVTCLLAFGIAGCAREFVPLFFGSGYESCVELVYWFIPVLLVKANSIFFRMQYLVPKHKDFAYSIATIVGASINLILNFILITIYGAKGAVIGTLIAETAVLIVQYMYNEKDISFLSWLVISSKYFIFGIIIFIVMRFSSCAGNTLFLNVFIEIIVGGLLYVLLCVSNFGIIKIKDKILKD